MSKEKIANDLIEKMMKELNVLMEGVQDTTHEAVIDLIVTKLTQNI